MGGQSGNIPTYGYGYTSVPKNEGDPFNGNPPTGTPPQNLGNPSVTAPTQPYSPQGAYATPTFGYTPYSPYAGLAQQIKSAMNPNLFGYAAPRTGLSDMAYSPWSMLYGGPSQVPFPGSLPPGAPPTPPGTITPPPPPPTTTPTGTPGAGTGTSGQGGYYTGGGAQTGGGGLLGTATPPTAPPSVPTTSVPGGGGRGGMGMRFKANTGQDEPDQALPYSGPMGGGASEPGTLLRDMLAAGVDMSQIGGRLFMSAGRQGQYGGTLSNEELIAATKQGAPVDRMMKGKFKNGKWWNSDGSEMRGRGNQFNYRYKG